MKSFIIFSLIAIVLNKVNKLRYNLTEFLTIKKPASEPNYDKEFAEEIIKSLGYSYELHKAQTEDGYINTYWRIPSKQSSPTVIGKPIMLQHGIFDTGFVFIQLKEKSIAFQLVDAGYDVWITNTRGNYRSHDHISLDYSDIYGKYWDYTLDNLVDYDLPTAIEYIKAKTGYSKIDFLGDSQGTTIFFLKFLADGAYLSRNIKHFIGLGVAPSMAHSPNKLFEIASPFIDIIAELIPFKRMLFLNDDLHTLLVMLAKNYPEYASYLIDFVAGYYPSGKINFTDLANLFYYYPGGTSKRNLLHWFQNYIKKKWTRYDFGSSYLNKEKYGQEEPPEYKKENYQYWDIPTIITISDNDKLSSKEDIMEFYDLVDKKSLIKLIDAKDYNHADIVNSQNAADEIFPQIIAHLKSKPK